MKPNRSGMTLTELTIVSVIMVIIASLAIPNYFKTVEESRSSEAKANLGTIYFAQKIFRENNNNKYYPTTDGARATSDGTEFAEMKTQLNVDFTTNYYTITITTSGSASTYTAVAVRNGGSRTYTLDPDTGNIAASGSF